MRAYFLFLGAFALFTSAYAQAPDAAPSTPVDIVELAPFEPTREDAVLEAYVDGVVTAHMREHKAPAVSVSVVKDGRIVFAKAYGEADIEARAPANGTDSLFRIGSVSKTFIWTAVMMLHERGQIDLDADVNDYLDDVIIPDAFDAPVTMNHLMAHRAGFEDTLGVFTISDGDDISLADALNAHMPKRVFPPGARTSYSNWGSALAAKIVEDVSGVPYSEFLNDEILGPLAMTHTTLLAPALMDDDTRASLSKGYRLRDGAYEEAEFLGLGPYAPAGGMSSSAHDMAQWMLFHLGGGAHDGVRLMTPQTHALMWSRAFRDRPAGADMAHGFQAGSYRGVETFGHGGATPAYFTNMTMAPDMALGVYVSQSAALDRTLVFDLAPLVLDHLLDRPAELAPADPDFTAFADAFAGSYLNNRRSFSQFEKLFEAQNAVTISAAPGGALTVVAGGEATRYAPLPGAADTFESRNGKRIVFGRNDAGDVTHFSDSAGVHSFERVNAASNPRLYFIALGAVAFFSMTMMLGAWRRQGRNVTQEPIGALLGKADIAASLAVFAFAGTMLWMIAQMSGAGPAALLSYPPVSVTAMRFAGLAIFVVAVFGAISLWPAWRHSGWSLWRKLHHALFAVSLIFFAVMLVFWNVIFAGTA